MLEEITVPLLEWYDRQKRILPWRSDPSPYRVWVSEIMLQQTRVEAVKPYFARFMEALPTVTALAECPEQELLKLWEGLGYYNRVRNLQKAAQVLVEESDGEIPAEYEKLLQLPGIGKYTAGAIASIAFGIPVSAVDGNVLRVITRLTADESDIAKDSVKQEISEKVQKIIPEDRAGDFNQALIELGAIVCVPNGMAKCSECPVPHLCEAKKQDKIMELPKKAAKKPRVVEKKTVLVIKDGEKVAIRKRPKKGLLAGLYELPNVEGELSEDEVLRLVKSYALAPLFIKKLENAKHIFTHKEWHMTGYAVRVEELEKETEGMLFVDMETMKSKYPIPSAFEAYAKHMNREEKK